jgi:hypothetical protein
MVKGIICGKHAERPRYAIEMIFRCVCTRLPQDGALVLRRGVIASYETVRRSCTTSEQAYADGLRRGRRRPGVNGI